jgi:hypothetical protein
MQEASAGTVLGKPFRHVVHAAGVTSTFFHRDGKFFVRTEHLRLLRELEPGWAEGR